MRTFVDFAHASIAAAHRGGRGGRAHFGEEKIGPGGVVEFFVSMDDINLLTERMAQLNTDVIDFRIPELTCEPGTEGCLAEDFLNQFYLQRELNAFKWRWTAFYVAWLEWVDDHYNHLSRLGAEPVQEFEQYQRNYNELLRQYNADFARHGATTEAPKYDAIGPGRDATVKQVTDTLSLIAFAVVAVAGVVALRTVKAGTT